MCQLAEFLFRVAGSLVSRHGEASTSVKGYGREQKKKKERVRGNTCFEDMPLDLHLPPPHFYHSLVQ